MKYLSQFAVILAFSLAGEVLRFLLPLPIPAAIYGLLLLFLALLTGIVKTCHIKEAASWLLTPATICLALPRDQIARQTLCRGSKSHITGLTLGKVVTLFFVNS